MSDCRQRRDTRCAASRSAVRRLQRVGPPSGPHRAFRGFAFGHPRRATDSSAARRCVIPRA